MIKWFIDFADGDFAGDRVVETYLTFHGYVKFGIQKYAIMILHLLIIKIM